MQMKHVFQKQLIELLVLKFVFTSMRWCRCRNGSRLRRLVRSATCALCCRRRTGADIPQQPGDLRKKSK